MQIYSNTTDFQLQGPCAVTLGKFEGLHRGHQKLLRALLAEKARGLVPAVFTFAVSPRSAQAGPGSGPRPQLLTLQEKRRRLEVFGVEELVEFPFNQQTSHLSPEEFLTRVILGQMRAKVLIVGSDFRFGYERRGDAAFLQANAARLGYEVLVLDKEQDGGQDISSTRIRAALEAGRMEEVSRLLGYDYTFSGTVVHGEGNGHKLGMPTANLVPEEGKLLPPFGVYGALMRLEPEGDAADAGAAEGVQAGQSCGAAARPARGTNAGQESLPMVCVANLGRKPTIQGSHAVGLEVHAIGQDFDLYGRRVCCSLLQFLRGEQHFGSAEELMDRMRQDRTLAEQHVRQIAAARGVTVL